jgi:O-antigen ligase
MLKKVRAWFSKPFIKDISLIDFLFYVTLFVAFLSVPIFATYIAPVVPWFTFALFAFVATFGIAFCHPFRWNFVAIALLVYSGVIVLSTLVNLRSWTPFSFTPYLMITVSLLIVLYISGDRYKCKRVIVALWFACLIFAILFICFYAKDILSGSFTRLGRDFGDPNEQSLYFSFGFIISFYFIFFGSRKWTYFLSIPSCLCFAACGLFTGSKAFLLVSIVSAIVLLICKFGRKRWYVSAIIIACLLVVFLIVLFTPQFSFLRTRIEDLLGFIKQTGFDSSTDSRLFKLLDSLVLFSRKVLLGFGTNGYHLHGPFGEGWAENNYAEVAVDYGILGLIAYFSNYVFVFVKFFRKKQRNNEDIISFVICVLLLMWMVSLPLDTIKFVPFVSSTAFSFWVSDKDAPNACDNGTANGSAKRIRYDIIEI